MAVEVCWVRSALTLGSVARKRCWTVAPTATDCQVDRTARFGSATDDQLPPLSARWRGIDDSPLGSVAPHETRTGTVESSVVPAISLVQGATSVGGIPSATTRVTFVVRVSPSPTPVIVSG